MNKNSVFQLKYIKIYINNIISFKKENFPTWFY